MLLVGGGAWIPVGGVPFSLQSQENTLGCFREPATNEAKQKPQNIKSNSLDLGGGF